MEMAAENSMDINLISEDDKPSETSDKNDYSEMIDLSGRGLRKLDKNIYGSCRQLILDKNDLTKLENIESYGNIRKLSLRDNKFVRMYCICRLIHLRELDLSNNNIVVIEGLRELIHLNVLKLSGNKIKVIEHISTNTALEHLDLSNNNISSLSDLSHLKMLHTLLLNNNCIKQITNASANLPGSLFCLNLAQNVISDLNQVSFLGELSNLEELFLVDNPCIDLSQSLVAFDHRPYAVSWCQALKFLDGYVVSSKENLKAEWLYSMGKGRQFRIGEHAELVDYLSNVCPLTALEDLTSQEDVKLNRILKQRRQHQQQLLVEMSIEDQSKLKFNSLVPPPSPNKLASHGEFISFPDRTKSGLPIRTHSKASGLTNTSASSNSHLNTPISRQNKSSVGKSRNSNSSNLNDGAIENYHLTAYESDADYCLSSKGDVPSDVPESSYLESPVTSSPLKSDTQYVPVPETMLSPDFRPISNSFHAGMYENDNAGDGETEFPQSWASWTQSSIPRNVSLQKNIVKNVPPVSNDWPVAKRPTQVQRVQKTTRPLSLSPSNYRRSPSSKHKSSPRPTSARSKDKSVNMDDSSSDSDISISKLVLVKEAVARKTKDAAAVEVKRNHLNTEETKNRGDADSRHYQKQKSESRKEKNEHFNNLNDSESNCKRNKAAIKIQSFWRGYLARHKRQESSSVRLEIRLRRAEDHVQVLQRQLAITQEELACEKRFRNMQMDAIKSLWAQVQQLHANYLEEKNKIVNSSESKEVIKNEALTLSKKNGTDTSAKEMASLLN